MSQTAVARASHYFTSLRAAGAAPDFEPRRLAVLVVQEARGLPFTFTSAVVLPLVLLVDACLP